jgi:predicted glycogen debranching enzyme
LEYGMCASAALPRVIDFGREICGDLAAAESREWLVTNGIGGFACGTLAGTLTRRYHGLLVAALPAPWHRTLLVSKIDEGVEYAGQSQALGANRWASGVIDPDGYRYIERFRLEGTVPVWTFACADAFIEKRIWMEHGANTTYVQYTVVSASGPLKLAAKVLVNWRGYHCLTHASEGFISVQSADGGLRVQAFAEAPPFYFRSAEAGVEPAHIWYRNYELAVERSRGLDHQEDHLLAGTFHAELRTGDSMTLVAGTDPAASLDGKTALQSRFSRDHTLIEQCARAHPEMAEWPAWIKQLILAADQLVVTCPLAHLSGCSSVIAGYPWFGDWGRDTMIALPGLLLATGRAEIAAGVLRTYARFVDRGMLPNRFSDAGEAPEYNTVDAALWFFEAVRQYYAATHDLSLGREIFPALEQIISEYSRGTRYNIHVDSTDGLLYAGEPGVQLTWMDAKVGDWVVTPRVGKPVEVNALWLNALATQAKLAEALGESAAPYWDLAAQARQGFQRFWNASLNCCFDVIDGPMPAEGVAGDRGGSMLRPAGGLEGNDASLRPNQILAVALEESPLTAEQQRAVVDICARELLTPFGLRSLSPQDPRYRGHYSGDQGQRDAAYHQGTAWGWLIGPFIHAFLRVTQDSKQARNFLAPFEIHLKVHGLGTASEIFDGDPPFTPHGCFAQAWTVAEVLRAWVAVATWDTGDGARDSGKS